MGDLPNTIYVLAFDRQRVERALAESDDPSTGRAYLEKILQVSHDIPQVREADISTILGEGLDEILASLPHGPVDETHSANIMAFVVRPLFSTVRDVRRYLSALPVTLRSVGDEVALPDVLALEAVRTHVPDVFAMLPEALNALTEVLGRGRQERDAHRKTQLEEIIKCGRQHAATIREMCVRLFPASKQHLDNYLYDEASAVRWKRQRLVAHSDISRFYLERSLPAGTASAAAIQHLVSLAGDRAQFTAALSALDPAILRRRLEDLLEHEDTIPSESIPVALEVILNQAPRLPTRKSFVFDLGAYVVVQRLAFYLLQRVGTQEDRLALLQALLPRIAALSVRLDLLAIASKDIGGETLVSPDSVRLLQDELRSQTIQATPDTLATDTALGKLLAWAAETGTDADRATITTVIQNDAVLLSMLRSTLAETLTIGMGDAAPRRSHWFRWDVVPPRLSYRSRG